MQNLIGLTTNEAKKEIEKAEKGRFYQCYIVIVQHINKTTFKMNKRVHEHNSKGERIYHDYKITNRVYAKNQDLEKDSFIIDSYIKKGKHSYLGLTGFVNCGEGTHNIYYLVIDHLQKGNRGTIERLESIKTDIPYKANELTAKQRRFCL